MGFPGKVNPSLVLGLGKGTELNYSILIGGGVSFGVESKFALSTGLNFSSIKQLSGQYTDNAGNRLLVPISTTKINTYNIIKRGFFLSLTYSLGLTKKTQEASKPAAEEGKKEDKEDASTEEDAAKEEGGDAKKEKE